MRIVVLSDSHRNVGRLFAAVERHLDNADLYIFLGDGEETTNQVIDLLIDCKKKGLSKKEFLLKAKDITGIYVPSFYEDSYNEDGTLK